MKGFILGLLGAFAVIFLMGIIKALTGWNSEFLEGWFAAVVFCEIDRHYIEKKKKNQFPYK